MDVEQIDEILTSAEAPEPEHSLSRVGGRQRKSSSYNNADYNFDENAVKKEIRKYSKQPKRKLDNKKVSKSVLEAPKRLKRNEVENVVVPVVESKSTVSKLKELDKLEDNLIAKSKLLNRARCCCAVHALPRGATEYKNILEAAKYAASSSNTLLLNWASPEAARIGSICKVYWDGEREWFDARVLNYDHMLNLYFVSFPFNRFVYLRNQTSKLYCRSIILKIILENGLTWRKNTY